MRFTPILSMLGAAILLQGCLAFPYPTPAVSGSVIDAASKKPIGNAQIQVRRHSGIHCTSTADGRFDLPAGSVWGPCFLMPGDYLVMADVCFRADGYQSVTNHYSAGMDRPGLSPIVLQEPIELQRKAQP
jgi:hypothetical protein